MLGPQKQHDRVSLSQGNACEKAENCPHPSRRPNQQHCADVVGEHAKSSVCSSPSIESSTNDGNLNVEGKAEVKAAPKERSVSTSSALFTDWNTTAILVSFYLIALLVAILHAIMMHYLDGKPTDDKNYMYLAQPYVTSVNILLVAAFKASLCASLTIAFTQHLWSVMRNKALAVSIIESLHGARSNPFLLAAWQVAYTTPLLYLMSLLMWLLAVAILFPPSALTVIQNEFQQQMPHVVPTFDAAYGHDFGIITRFDQEPIVFGNSSLSAWLPLTKIESPTNTSSMTYLFPNSKLVHLSHVVLISGAVPGSQSPCGLNCAYVINFNGPTFQCNATSWNETDVYEPGTVHQYYSGRWQGHYNRHSMFTSLKLNLTRLIGSHDRWMIQEVYTLHCQPAWAEYSIKMTYANGSRTISTTMTSGGTLADTLVKGVRPTVNGEWPITLPDTPAYWSADTIRNLEALNSYAVLDAIVASLAGSYDQIAVPASGPNFTSTALNDTQLSWAPLDTGFTWYNSIYTSNGTQWSAYESKELLPNRTVIRDTHFNLNRDNRADTRPSFHITEDILNEMVANVTIATMLGYFPLETLNQTVTANVTTSRNVYSFSRPLNLVLPYALSLVFSLPFLVIGFISLRRNGIAAQSDSFIQLLVAMTRSKELDSAAMAGSIGGKKMAMNELKQTKIMFGEIADPNGNGGKRRLGFGLEHEITRGSR